MEVLCTICSKEKNGAEGLLPARLRYVSGRIEFVSQESRRLGTPFLIFSGKYGLLDADAGIPWYDRRLETGGVGDMISVVTGQLREKGVTRILFYARPPATPGWKPYYDVLEEACGQLGVALSCRPIDEAWSDS